MATKNQHYFSHDINARHDEKISAIRFKYPRTGYGDWWILVEMLACAKNYEFTYSEATWEACAMQMQSTTREVHEFVDFCISRGLLILDNGAFFSLSLKERMKKRDEVVTKKRMAAKSRWGTEQEAPNGEGDLTSGDAHAMHMQSKTMQIKLNKKEKDISKVDLKEKTTKKEKKVYGQYENVFLTDEQYQKLVAQYGETGTRNRIENMSSGIAAKPKSYKYENFYAAIQNWEKHYQDNPRNKVVPTGEGKKDYSETW